MKFLVFWEFSWDLLYLQLICQSGIILSPLTSCKLFLSWALKPFASDVTTNVQSWSWFPTLFSSLEYPLGNVAQIRGKAKRITSCAGWKALQKAHQSAVDWARSWAPRFIRSHLYVNSHIRSLLSFAFKVRDVKLHVQMIDRQLILPRVILQNAGEEGLSEVESAEPVNRRFSVVHPSL